MYKEIEYKYFNVDTNALRQRLRKVNAQLVRPKIIMKLIRFTHPINNPDSYVRIRDESDRTTMTSKTNLNDKFVTEYEVVISDFSHGVKILESLGCKKIYFLEKFRETWNYMDVEIVIDSLPGTSEYIEIEGKDETHILKVQHILGLDEPITHFRKYDLYYSEYGTRSEEIILGDIRFNNAMIKLYPKLCINKEKFIQTIEKQLEEISKSKLHSHL